MNSLVHPFLPDEPAGTQSRMVVADSGGRRSAGRYRPVLPLHHMHTYRYDRPHVTARHGTVRHVYPSPPRARPATFPRATHGTPVCTHSTVRAAQRASGPAWSSPDQTAPHHARGAMGKCDARLFIGRALVGGRSRRAGMWRVANSGCVCMRASMWVKGEYVRG